MVRMVCRYLLLAVFCTGLARAQTPATKSGVTDEQKALEEAGKLVGQQHAWAGAAATSATKLIFKQKSREKAAQGTLIIYHLSAPYLPKAQHYTMISWPLTR